MNWPMKESRGSMQPETKRLDRTVVTQTISEPSRTATLQKVMDGFTEHTGTPNSRTKSHKAVAQQLVRYQKKKKQKKPVNQVNKHRPTETDRPLSSCAGRTEMHCGKAWQNAAVNDFLRGKPRLSSRTRLHFQEPFAIRKRTQIELHRRDPKENVGWKWIEIQETAILMKIHRVSNTIKRWKKGKVDKWPWLHYKTVFYSFQGPNCYRWLEEMTSLIGSWSFGN